MINNPIFKYRKWIYQISCVQCLEIIIYSKTCLNYYGIHVHSAHVFCITTNNNQSRYIKQKKNNTIS